MRLQKSAQPYCRLKYLSRQVFPTCCTTKLLTEVSFCSSTRQRQSHMPELCAARKSKWQRQLVAARKPRPGTKRKTSTASARRTRHSIAKIHPRSLGSVPRTRSCKLGSRRRIFCKRIRNESRTADEKKTTKS